MKPVTLPTIMDIGHGFLIQSYTPGFYGSRSSKYFTTKKDTEIEIAYQQRELYSNIQVFAVNVVEQNGKKHTNKRYISLGRGKEIAPVNALSA